MRTPRGRTMIGEMRPGWSAGVRKSMVAPIAGALMALVVSSNAAACNAEFVQSLRTNANYKSKATFKSTDQRRMCNTALNGNYSAYSAQGVSNIAKDAGSMNFRKKCSSSQATVTATDEVEWATSSFPPEAIPLLLQECGNGLFVTVAVSRSGAGVAATGYRVSVSAAFKSDAVAEVALQRISVDGQVIRSDGIPGLLASVLPPKIGRNRVLVASTAVADGTKVVPIEVTVGGGQVNRMSVTIQVPAQEYIKKIWHVEKFGSRVICVRGEIEEGDAIPVRRGSAVGSCVLRYGVAEIVRPDGSSANSVWKYQAISKSKGYYSCYRVRQKYADPEQLKARGLYLGDLKKYEGWSASPRVDQRCAALDA